MPNSLKKYFSKLTGDETQSMQKAVQDIYEDVPSYFLKK